MLYPLSETIRSISSVTRDLWRDGSGWILVTVAIGWFFSLGVRLVFPALLPHLRAEFGLSLSAAGFLLSTLYIAYSLGQFPSGMLCDRIGERWALAASMLVSGGALASVILSVNSAMLFVSVSVFGFGTALFANTRYTTLLKVYPERDGTANGITSAVGNIGTSVLPATAVLIAAYYGWQAGLGIPILFFIATGIAFLLIIPRDFSTSNNGLTVSTDSMRRIFAGIATREILVTTLLLLVIMFIWQAFTSFFPTYLVSEKGLTEQSAALVFGAFFAFGIGIQPVSGAIGDAFGVRKTLIVVLTLSFIGMLLLPFVHGLYYLLAITFLLSMLLGSMPVAIPHLVTLLPADIRGSGLGFLRTTYILGASAGPSLVGILADTGYFDEAFLFLALLGICAVGITLALPSQARRG